MLGAVYGLVALGFVLIYKSSGVFNFVQGELLILGALICYTFLVMLQLPLWLSLILTFIVAAGIGLLIERLALRPLIGQPILSLIMITIALSSLLAGIYTLIWSAIPKAYPEFISSAPMHLGSIAISRPLTISFIACLVLVGVFMYFFRYHKWGLAMRVTSEGHEVAQSMGINVKTVFSISWAIVCVVSAIGGILLGSMVGISPILATLGLAVFPCVILGGLDSVGGAIIGGLIVGWLQSLAAGYLDPLVGGGIREVFPFIVLLLVLMVKPYGLFGLVRIERI